MKITICNRIFDTQDIKDIEIRNNRVFIDTEDEYFEIRYTDEKQVQQAKDFIQFQTLKRTELINAVNLIMLTCDYFINQKEQCAPCPLKKRYGCVFTHLPIEWRN